MGPIEKAYMLRFPNITVWELLLPEAARNQYWLCDKSETESDDDSHGLTIQEGTSTTSDRRLGHWCTRYADCVQSTGAMTDYLATESRRCPTGTPVALGTLLLL